MQNYPTVVFLVALCLPWLIAWKFVDQSDLLYRSYLRRMELGRPKADDNLLWLRRDFRLPVLLAASAQEAWVIFTFFRGFRPNLLFWSVSIICLLISLVGMILSGRVVYQAWAETKLAPKDTFR